MLCFLKIFVLLPLLVSLASMDNSNGQISQRFLTLDFCDVSLDARTSSMFFLDESGSRWIISIVAPKKIAKVEVPALPTELAKILANAHPAIDGSPHKLVLEEPEVKRQVLVPGSEKADEIKRLLESEFLKTKDPGDLPLVSALQLAIENEEGILELLREHSDWLKNPTNNPRRLKFPEED